MQVVGFTLILLLGIMVVLIFDGGAEVSVFRKIQCWLGKHNVYRKRGKVTINKYYCKYCKKPRKHPQLKILDGGNKMGQNRTKF